MEVFKPALYKNGKDRAINYIWSLPASRLVSINVRWFSAGFMRE